jgi:hypothetical protein
LNDPGHDRVATPAHCDVQRRTRLARIAKACGESNFIEKTLGLDGGLDLSLAIATPAQVAVFLDLIRKYWPQHGRLT